MIILIDTKEQKPILWDKINNPKFPNLKIKYKHLDTGDYSIQGYHNPSCQHSIVIERKSLPDLFGSCGRGRVNLEKEFVRMSKFDHSEVCIEADLKTIFKNPPELSMMKPKSVYRTLVAWSQRYGVNVWPCPNRAFMEMHIFLTLKRFYDDREPGGDMEFCKL